eukprot:7299457-Heterocapsa_arctica.AAC.1
MEFAYCANAQTQVYNISGGNAWHAALCQTWGAVAAQSDQNTNECRTTLSLDRRGHHKRVDCTGGNRLHETAGPLSTMYWKRQKGVHRWVGDK